VSDRDFKLLHFPGDTRARIDPDDVLRGALGLCHDVVLIGIDREGRSFIASSIGTVPEVNMALDQAKLNLLLDVANTGDGDEPA